MNMKEAMVTMTLQMRRTLYESMERKAATAIPPLFIGEAFRRAFRRYLEQGRTDGRGIRREPPGPTITTAIRLPRKLYEAMGERASRLGYPHVNLAFREAASEYLEQSE